MEKGLGIAAMGKGKSKAKTKGYPSCLKGFIELCEQGWLQGWHERNGGNLSYRMTAGDLAEFALWKDIAESASAAWTPLPEAEPGLAGAWFLVTRSGGHMRLVGRKPSHGVGLIELDDAGSAWRLRWGCADGGRPTSELPTHMAVHSSRKTATAGANRVVYHAHTPNLIAMSYVLSAEDREITRALWKTLPECVMTVPEGVGVVDWAVPGSRELADATRVKMDEYAAVLWAFHGLVCTGVSFDEALGLAHTLEKAAQIYRYARQMNGGNDGFWSTIPDEGLRASAQAAGVQVNEDFLAEKPAKRPCGFAVLG